MAELTRGGVRIYYEVAGPGGDGPALPVLLSHAFGETCQMWKPNLPALAAARTVLSWDMRGHGLSDSPADPSEYTQEACVGDMAALLDAAGVGRAVIGGLSLGGYLSLAFWLAHPDRVAALMLFDTGPGFRNDEARQRWNERAHATAARLEDAGLARAARGMLTQQDGRVIDALPSVNVPVLVLVGGEDRPFLGAADYVAAKVPDATRVVIPGAGHMCNVDEPERFNHEVLGFLGGLDERTAGGARAN